MGEFTKTELEAAQKAISSTIRKNEKVQETLSQKQPPRTSQLTYVSRNLKVLYIGSSLIARALKEDSVNDYSKEDLEDAVRTIPSLIHQIEKVQPRFKQGTPQYTLAERRIKAFHIALSLIMRELESHNE